MPLALDIDRQDENPIYRQIAEQIKEHIGDGRLPTGTRLPTIRELAQTVGVTRLTVQNAYNELQAEQWIASQVGRGTFVTASARPKEIMRSVGRRITTDDILRDEYLIKQIAGVRLMGSADPDTSLFPLEDFWSSFEAEKGDATLFNYGAAHGDTMLRVEFAAYLRERGLDARPDELLVTSGVTHGLSLITQALARPGDCIAVEQPTYLGFLNLLKAQNLQAVGVPLDDEGPDLEALERVIIQRRPRFFYTVPSFQNPTGLCTSAERRRDLLALAERYGLLLVEDDVYGRLAYDTPAPLPLKANDPHDLVIYLDSVSKVLMPGLRVGVVLAPLPLRERLVSLRQAQDLCGNPLVQRTLAHFLRQGKLKKHLQHSLPHYRERREALVQALRQNMPAGVRWSEPKGGFCLWLSLPDEGNFDDLYRAALNRGLIFTPGEVFLAEPDSQKHLRLCFGNQSVSGIRKSIALLATLIEERLSGETFPEQKLADWPPLV